MLKINIMHWTKEEDLILKNNFEILPKQELQSLLPKRSWDAILTRGKCTFNLNRSNFRNFFKSNNQFRKGKVPWNKGIPFESMKGEKNPRFKGYSYISDRGYKYIKTEDGSTNTWNFYRPEHIIVVEKYLGRKISRTKNGKGEGVHHIDGNKLNNDISNLLVYKDEKEHRSFHNQLQELCFQLVQLGLIKFNKEEKQYYYAE